MLRSSEGEPQAILSAPGVLTRVRSWAPRSLSRRISDSWDLVAVASIVAGTIVRFVWGMVVHPPVDFLYSDMGGYIERAQRLAAGGELWRVDAFWPPGTHMLLAAPLKLFGAGSAGLWAGAVLWCVLSSLIPLFAWRLARVFLSPAAAALTATLCAIWPLYITYGAFFTSETPSLALMLAALWAGYRASRRSGRLTWGLGLLAGMLGGAAIACRPQWILNLALLALPLAWRFRRRALIALASIAAGAAFTLGGVLVHNSVVAGKPTGPSENSGLNFWMGHCNVHDVEVADPLRNLSFGFGNPVPAQLGRGGTYYFEGPMIWDQSFFYGMGLGCIRNDGPGHVLILAQSVLDMTATTVPWPQVNDESGQRGVVRASNVAYSWLLPFVVIGSLLLVRKRRAAGRPSGELVMLAHLLCVAVVALVFFGDPRLRSSYDVFGLALMATLVVDWFGLSGDDGRREGEDQAPMDPASGES
jgi:4-amino-4-deoxy-L-arabinose transferase-like glycosyltransferase